jgi:hypothetical protein
MDIFLHMGFPKTGSSTLQFGLFKPLESRYNLNLLTWRKTNDEESLDNRPSSRLFNNQNIDSEYLNFIGDKVNIFSDESMTAPLRLRRLNYGYDIKSPFDFPKELKQQIESKYPDQVINYTVFITIRNQSKLIFSQYVEEYNWKIYKNIDLLFNEKGNIDVSGYDIYKFDDYLTTLIKTFGKDSVVLTLFEDWHNNFDSFCEIISSTFRIQYNDVNSSLKKHHVNAKTKTESGVYSKGNKAFVPYLTKHQQEEIMNYFYDSNMKLAKKLDLHEKFLKYGYIK